MARRKGFGMSGNITEWLRLLWVNDLCYVTIKDFGLTQVKAEPQSKWDEA